MTLNIDEAEDYWRKRRQLQSLLLQRDEQLEEARAALLDGSMQAAKQQFGEAQQHEQEALDLAHQLQFAAPVARVAAIFAQSVQEKYEALLHDQQTDAESVRVQLQALAEIEREIGGAGAPSALPRLAQTLDKKLQQALQQNNFQRADEFLAQLSEPGIASNVELGAALVAAGQQAQSQRQNARAHRYFQHVPADAPQAAQARAQAAAPVFSSRMLLGGGIALLLVAAIVGFAFLRNWPNIQAAASSTSVAAASTSQPTEAAVATSPAAAPTAAPPASAVATATPQPIINEPTSVATPTSGVVEQLRVNADRLVVYRNAFRKRGEEIGTLRTGDIVLKCAHNTTERSYYIAAKSCASPLGWVNQLYVDIVISTP